MSTTETEKKPMSYAEYLDSVKAGAETARLNAEKTANNAYQSALSTANANYNKAKSEYGANAEALGGMGLRGSGYSNYLNSQAYAQKQSAYNNAQFSYQAALADAEARKAATNLEADGLMAQYLQQKEANKLNAFNTLMGNIGTYGSLADIKAIASANGIDDTDMLNQLAASRSAYIRNNLTGTNYTLQQLNDLVKLEGEGENEKVIGGELTDADYKALKKGVYKVDVNSITADGFYDNDKGKMYDYDTAKKYLDGIKASGAPSEVITKWETLFNSLYTPNTNGNVEYFKGDGFRTGDEGNNFKVKSGDDKYKVQYGAEADESVTRTAQTLKDGTVFKLGGVLYIKRGNKVYEIKARVGYAGQFNNLLALFDDTTT